MQLSKPKIIEFNGTQFMQILDSDKYVSANGDIYSDNTKGLCKLTTISNNLYTTAVSITGKRKTVMVALMVAQCWVSQPPYPGRNYIHFINGDSFDLKASNIKWISRDERLTLLRSKEDRKPRTSYLKGKKLPKATKRKMAEAKKGSGNPKHIGSYITPWGTFDSIELAHQSSPEGVLKKSIYNRCKGGHFGYGFKVNESNMPDWYIKATSKDTSSLRNSVALHTDLKVSRGKKRVRYLTPAGLFGDIETASQIIGISGHEIQKLCVMGKGGYNIFTV